MLERTTEEVVVVACTEEIEEAIEERVADAEEAEEELPERQYKFGHKMRGKHSHVNLFHGRL